MADNEERHGNGEREEEEDEEQDTVELSTDSRRAANADLRASSFGGTADGDVWIKRQRRDVSLSKDGLQILGNKTVTIPITEIIAVEILPVAKFPWAYGLGIHTIKVKKDGRWLPDTKLLRFRSFEILQRWHDRLQSLIDGDTVRPKKLRVFVNPYGGKRTAAANFKKVLKLFTLAKIRLDTVVTERMSFAEQWMMTADLTGYDGAVAVGGDGLFNEMINGMLRREDGHRLLVGLIPSGSTDTVAYSSHGTRDVVTAALHIILGDRHPMDICKVTLVDGEVRYCTNFLSYGYFGDVVKDSERHRWMGPSRYDYSGFKTLMKSKSYGVKVRYVRCDERDVQPPHEFITVDPGSMRGDNTAGESVSISPSGAGMSLSHVALASIDGDTESRVSQGNRDQWQDLEGAFKSFSLTVIPCINDKSRAGFDPRQHLSNGVLSMIAVQKCGRASFLRFLARVSNKSWDQFGLSGVTRIPVTKVSFEAVGPQSSWNLDGEIVHSAKLEAEVLPSALTLFARGPEAEGRHRVRPYPVAVNKEILIDIAEVVDEPKRHFEQQMPEIELKMTSDADTDIADLHSVRDVAVQTLPLPEIFSVSTNGCYSSTCMARNASRRKTSAPCYCASCRHNVLWPVEEVLQEETLPEEEFFEAAELEAEPLPEAEEAEELIQQTTFRTKYPDVEDPFEVIETFVSLRKLRLVDLFKNVGSRNSNAKGANKEEFAKRLRELGIHLTPLQFSELFLRLDRNKDNIVTYKDLVNCRKRYNLRMKAADPAWQKYSQAPDDVHHKDTFMVRPSPRHVYPAV